MASSFITPRTETKKALTPLFLTLTANSPHESKIIITQAVIKDAREGIENVAGCDTGGLTHWLPPSLS